MSFRQISNLKLVSNVEILIYFFVFCWIKKKDESLQVLKWNHQTFFKSWRNLKMHLTATLKNTTSKGIRYSTPISTCNALYKWQDPHIIVDSSKFRIQNSKFDRFDELHITWQTSGLFLINLKRQVPAAISGPGYWGFMKLTNISSP